MTGDKRPVFVVGEQRDPKCFRNVKHLPVRYESNRPAYMTDDLFKSFLQEWDNELLFQNRKILLLVDTCPPHLTGAYLTNIEMAFLPPNTTVLQPCEQGVSQMVKATFRRKVCFHVINRVESSEYEETAYDVAERMSLLDAAHFLQAAWSEVDDQVRSRRDLDRVFGALPA